MEIKQMEAFLKVVEAGSFTAAANELFITQPTISLRIRLLEDELNMKLFNRADGKRVELSEYGQKILPYFQDGYNIINTGIRNVKDLINEPKTCILSCPPNFGTDIITELLSKLNQTFPHLEFSVQSGSSPDIVKHVAEQKVNFGFIYANVKTNQEITATLVAKENVVLVSSPDHPLFKKKMVSALEIEKESIFIVNKVFISSQLIRQYFDKQHLKNYKMIEVANPVWLKTMVAKGLGIAFLKEMNIIDELKTKKLVKLNIQNPLPQVPIYLVYNNSHKTEVKETISYEIKKLFKQRAKASL